MCNLGRLFHNGGNVHSNLTAFFLFGDYAWLKWCWYLCLPPNVKWWWALCDSFPIYFHSSPNHHFHLSVCFIAPPHSKMLPAKKTPWLRLSRHVSEIGKYMKKKREEEINVKYWIKGKSCSPPGHLKTRKSGKLRLATQSCLSPPVPVRLPRYTPSKFARHQVHQNKTLQVHFAIWTNTFGYLDKYI